MQTHGIPSDATAACRRHYLLSVIGMVGAARGEDILPRSPAPAGGGVGRGQSFRLWRSFTGSATTIAFVSDLSEAAFANHSCHSVYM